MVRILALGSNSGGQLATGDTEDRHHAAVCSFEPGSESVAEDAGAWAVCGGGNHAFLWSSDGRQLFGCGYNSSGELAVSSDATRRELKWRRVELPDGCEAVRKVACGWSHTLLLGSNGRVYAAGSGEFGQLGTGTFSSSSGWTQLAADAIASTRFIDIACGLRHSLLLAADGSVYACGANRKGQLGNAALGAKVAVPVCVSRGLPPIAMVACGRAHSLMVAADGITVFAAGDDRFAQCGPVDDSLPKHPEALSWRQFRLSRRARKLCAGWEFGAVLTDPPEDQQQQEKKGGGTVLMWGRADNGQLGCESSLDGALRMRRSVEPVPLDGVMDLACGSNHVVAVTQERKVYAWGWNEHGNAGDPSLRDVRYPQPIALCPGAAVDADADADACQPSAPALSIGCGYGNTYVCI
ncbi:alpha tubulin suppressor [Coemansia sp. RSA 1285]|nr:alpha tubulin suppressor [Coemansia sp. RSA 1285]